MCTTVILRRPGHAWPLLLAANRDEIKTRPWQAPDRHWPSRSEVVAGLDEEAGGSWLGLNDHGVVAAILNRRGSLGPQAGKRSRGELVLEALDHADARTAAEALAQLEPTAYRSFNLVIADNQDAYWLRNLGQEGPGALTLFEIPEGLSMLTARDLNDLSSPRINAFLGRFRNVPIPDPGSGDWQSWEALMRSRAQNESGEPMAAMTIVTDSGFETTSSSLLALPAPAHPPRDPRPVWLFAAGRPDLVPYAPVTALAPD